MAKTDEEKLHIIHTVIGIIIAVFFIAFIGMGLFAASNQSEEQVRAALDEKYQDRLESCYKRAIADEYLMKQRGETDSIKYPYCQKEYIEDEKGRAKGIIIYYVHGFMGEKEEIFNSLKERK